MCFLWSPIFLHWKRLWWCLFLFHPVAWCTGQSNHLSDVLLVGLFLPNIVTKRFLAPQIFTLRFHPIFSCLLFFRTLFWIELFGFELSWGPIQVENRSFHFQKYKCIKVLKYIWRWRIYRILSSVPVGVLTTEAYGSGEVKIKVEKNVYDLVALPHSLSYFQD